MEKDIDKNIDKDIEILKQRLEPNRYGGKCTLGYSEKYCFGVNDMKAIENVLSELETKRFQLYLSNEELENALKKLETYKKIAEKLARFSCRIANYDGSELEQKTKETLDWARNEVENENNKNEI